MDRKEELAIIKQQRDERRAERHARQREAKMRNALKGIGKPSEWLKDHCVTVRMNKVAFSVLQAAGYSVQDVFNMAMDAMLWRRDSIGLEFKDGFHPLLTPEAEALHSIRPPVVPIPDVSEILTQDLVYNMNIERKEHKQNVKIKRVRLLERHRLIPGTRKTQAEIDKEKEMIRKGIEIMKEMGITEESFMRERDANSLVRPDNND